MSGIDPLAVMGARVAAAQAAMLEAAINLGVSAEVLQAQISIGDILAAKILPPQNGQDLIEVLGQRVAAQLPPGVHPGETLLLQVTGLSGTQIFVSNLGTPNPRNPLPVVDVVLKAPPAASEPAQQQQQQQQPAQTSQAVPRTQTDAPVSPPRAVFVAASVRAAQPAEAAQPAPQMQNAAPVHGVEARIAAAQAAKLPPVTRPAPPPAPVIPAKNAPVRSAATAVRAAVQTVSEFLRAARLPDTPFTRMAATIAPHAPERLPSVLQRLEAALPRVTEDTRIPTLRTLIGFTARLNPANAETLRAQISSYMSNVVEGVEAKLAQLLQAHVQASPSHAAPAALPARADAPPSIEPQPQPEAPPNTATTAQARAAERSAAISHDLKAVVLSLLRDPPAERTPAMTQALSETLITLTGAQVNALSSSQQNPGTFAFTLPVYYHDGGKPAQIRISRDEESRAAKMDADNFHVAFVLDTAHLGTVAIDVQTSGRAVKIDVKTENKPAAERFSDTLSSLRTRLEDLRYRVASAVANALPRSGESVAKSDASKSPSNGERRRGLDLHA